MALIRCPECDKEISDKAGACPHCGYPPLAADNKAKALGPRQPAPEQEITAPTNSEELVLPPHIESRLAAEIPPWEKEDLGRFAKAEEAPQALKSQPKPTIKLSKGTKRILSFFGGTALFIMILYASDAFYQPPPPKPKAESLAEYLPKEPPKPKVIEVPKPDVGSDWDAYFVAQSFVEKRLVSPSTAKFPTISQISVRNDDWNRWIVTGYVDSQNGFGAMIRTKYQAVLRYVGDEKYRLENLDFWK